MYHHIQTEGGDIINYSFVCKPSYTIRSLLQKEDTDSKDTLIIFLLTEDIRNRVFKKVFL